MRPIPRTCYSSITRPRDSKKSRVLYDVCRVLSPAPRESEENGTETPIFWVPGWLAWNRSAPAASGTWDGDTGGGRFYLGEPGSTPGNWIAGLAAIAAGVLLVAGFLTPIAGATVVAGGVAVAISLLPVCTPNLFDSRSAAVFGLTMLLSVIGLGPGAFSVDARMFGRREIIIPPSHHRAE